ncbi:hypothetical protein BDV12DRAFT_186683 [Aspergillus spectabilis]
MADQTLTIGILSIGDMGVGIANLLISHGYKVSTFAEDRSERTKERARSNGITLLPSLEDLVTSSTILLSIVPPRGAYTIAQHILAAAPSSSTSTRPQPLYYLDLNATSPSLAIRTHSLLSTNKNITFLDGGIIGGPPTTKNTPDPRDLARGSTSWKAPSIPVSGPTPLPQTYEHFAKILNIEHVSSNIGAASGVKMSFASLTKGIYALAIQSYVTADSLGVFPVLREYMERHNSGTMRIVDGGVVGMPPKAYRWVNEMQQIGAMMEEEGGWGRGLFEEIAEVYRVVAEDTKLGLEEIGRRERGTTVEDVVKVMREGMEVKKDKLE